MEKIETIISAGAIILSALISAAVTLIVCTKNNNAQQKRFLAEHNAQQDKFLAEMKEQASLTRYRLEQLEAKVNAHNHFDNRLAVMEERIKTLFNKLAS